ncbi:MAG TPA: DUF4347 domain-containing protein, partial [Pirellula sp.]|nr:DUF4347 domain-containing protein [Pirellula sp.]
VGDPSGDFTDGSNMSPDEWQSYLTELTTNSDCEAVHKIAAEIRAARGLSTPIAKMADETPAQVAVEVPVANSVDDANDESRFENCLNDGLDQLERLLNNVEQLSSTVPAPEIADSAHDVVGNSIEAANYLTLAAAPVNVEQLSSTLSSTVPAPEITDSAHDVVGNSIEAAFSFALDAAPEQLGQLFYSAPLAPDTSADPLFIAPLAPLGKGAGGEGYHNEIVFVQSGLLDYDALIADIGFQANALGRSISVVFLNGTENGFDQIDSVLSQYNDLSAIHFVSHGTDGMIQLGGSWLSSSNVQDHLNDMKQWGMALSADGDILIYGCDVAKGIVGQSLLETIAAATHADIAASTDKTGDLSRGGNWTFEMQLGKIETLNAFSIDLQESYSGLLATYTVTNTNDSGAGSLRQAIIDANANAGADTIAFNIAGTGVHTISPTTAMTTITGQVTIDATTDDSFAANGNKPAIMLDGNDLAADGLVLSSTADGSIIRGFVIRDFGVDGIEIQAGSDNNTITGNYIGGLTTGGITAGSAEANTLQGIRILGSNNTIGGTTDADRNVISANASYGVYIDGASATGNTIAGNYIGLTAAGTVVLANTIDGVLLTNSASSNTIGGSTTGHRNVISGNVDGIQIQNASSNIVQGNYIGTDYTGTVDLGNTGNGIFLFSAAQNNQILNNVISGNNSDGIDLGTTGTTNTGTIIRGNFIGTKADGTSSLGNTNHGIFIGDGGTANSTTVGGTTTGQGNTIAFNGAAGIYVKASTGVSILGNSIYSNAELG